MAACGESYTTWVPQNDMSGYTLGFEVSSWCICRAAENFIRFNNEHDFKQSRFSGKLPCALCKQIGAGERNAHSHTNDLYTLMLKDERRNYRA